MGGGGAGSSSGFPVVWVGCGCSLAVLGVFCGLWVGIGGSRGRLGFFGTSWRGRGVLKGLGAAIGVVPNAYEHI